MQSTVKTNGDRNDTNGTAPEIGQAEFIETRRGTCLKLTGILASKVRRASKREGCTPLDWVADALVEKVTGPIGADANLRRQADVRAALETLLAADLDKSGDCAKLEVTAPVNITLDTCEWLVLMKTAKKRGVSFDTLISRCLAEGCHPALDVTPQSVGQNWQG